MGDVDEFVSGLALGSIKNSGSSLSGAGHKLVNFFALGGIKDSGPSPGEGHANVNRGGQ